MIKGKVVPISTVGGVFPKFLVSGGNFEQAILIKTQTELSNASIPENSFLIEPVDALLPDNTYTVYGVDNNGESFILQVSEDNTDDDGLPVLPM